MLIIVDLFVLLASIVFCLSMWVLFQSNLTMKDRLRIIKKITDHPNDEDFAKLLFSFSNISHSDHLVRRLFLLNWRKLYSKEIQDLID
jgi:hypothetical protein